VRTEQRLSSTPNPHFENQTISSTVCVKGWTKTIRPPASYTSALKKQQLAEWGYADQNLAHYEEDHLISLELGGAPYSKKNLWPEPWSQAHKSDPRENGWHKKLCNGTLTLMQAQHVWRRAGSPSFWLTWTDEGVAVQPCVRL
jgi:hypothetical protein